MCEKYGNIEAAQKCDRDNVKNLYEQDFYAWTQKTAQLLKDRKFDAIDLDNLIEK